MSRIFAVLFAVAMLFTSFVTPAFAEDSACEVTGMEHETEGSIVRDRLLVSKGCSVADAAKMMREYLIEMGSVPAAAPAVGAADAPASGGSDSDVPSDSGIGMCEGLHDYQLQDLEEISADVEFIHVQFHTGGPERETLLPPGRYPVLKAMRGHVWELGPDCSFEQALGKHVMPSIERRKTMKANTAGYVSWEQFVKDGYVSVAWQPGDPAVSIEAEAVEVDAPEGAEDVTITECEGVRQGDIDGLAVTVPAGKTYVIDEAWESPTNGIVVFGEGKTITGYKGGLWVFSCNVEATGANLTAQDKKYTVK